MLLLVRQHVVLIVELSMAYAALVRHQIRVDDRVLSQVTRGGESFSWGINAIRAS